MSKIIMGVQLLDRVNSASGFQSLLSKYGSIIQTRIGVHEIAADTSGLIILDFIDNVDSEVKRFVKELSAIGDINVQTMVF